LRTNGRLKNDVPGHDQLHFGASVRRTNQREFSTNAIRLGITTSTKAQLKVNSPTCSQMFSQSIAAFWTDLGGLAEDTVIVTMSEFGRTARENGNRGTDHGHANVMFVLGGPVKGGKVYGRRPGLDQSQLHEGRDLTLTTDFRQIIGEVVAHHMGNNNLAQVFPGFDNQSAKFLKLLG
jgi:uncharacterized protein (DUF1501 family)